MSYFGTTEYLTRTLRAQARAVVYCSFLPNVAINREYAHQQRLNFQHGNKPTDQWINVDNDDGELTIYMNEHIGYETPTFSPLGRKLMGIIDWQTWLFYG